MPFPLKHFFLAHGFESFLTPILTKFCPPLLHWAKYTARRHGKPCSIAPLSAKMAETNAPLNGKVGSAELIGRFITYCKKAHGKHARKFFIVRAWTHLLFTEIKICTNSHYFRLYYIGTFSTSDNYSLLAISFSFAQSPQIAGYVYISARGSGFFKTLCKKIHESDITFSLSSFWNFIAN